MPPLPEGSDPAASRRGRGTRDRNLEIGYVKAFKSCKGGVFHRAVEDVVVQALVDEKQIQLLGGHILCSANWEGSLYTHDLSLQSGWQLD